MLFVESIINVIDNSGVKLVKCIKVLKKKPKQAAVSGDKIIVSVIKKVKLALQVTITKNICTGLLFHTKYPTLRLDGSYIVFFKNSIVLFLDKKTCLGNRLQKPLTKEIKFSYETLFKTVKYIL